jgi:hypothetical protein
LFLVSLSAEDWCNTSGTFLVSGEEPDRNVLQQISIITKLKMVSTSIAGVGEQCDFILGIFKLVKK